MKVPAARADAFAKAPDPKVRLILVYGPDIGLIKERAAALIASVVDDPADPFRIVNLSAAGITSDPARLGDEAAAISFGGGRRVVSIGDATDSLTKHLNPFLENPVGDALIVVEAGALGPRSSLRKLAESQGIAAALPCYLDEGRDLERVITQSLSGLGITADRDALAYLVDRLGGDRMMTRRELEKLALYVDNGESQNGGKQVTLADAVACVGDSAALTLDDLCFAVADGDQTAVARLLSRLQGEGVAPIAILRAAGRHFTRLHRIAAAVTRGDRIDDAVKSLRPPPFFKYAPRFKNQAQMWSASALTRAIVRLNEVESACKTTGAPDAILCDRTLTALTVAARRAAAN